MKFSIAATLMATLAPAAAQEVISLHGSGTTNPSKCYWHIMDLMQIQTKLPVKMTYRGVGSSTGQAEFIGNGTTSDNDFGSGDIPFSSEDYASFPANSILHLPIVLGAISFFHSVPTGETKLNLTPCVLAKIFKRDITEWTHPEIVELNPDLSLPGGFPISVARRVLGSSSTSSITQYLNTACPGEWPESLVGSTIDWPADTRECEGSGGMTDCILDTPGTIGYIDSGHGHAEELQEIELRNADNVYISSKEAATKGGIMGAAANAGFPDSLDGDFSTVNLLNQPGASTWPIVAMTYVYVRKDLTFLTNPASQTLLRAFLKTLYSDDYIPVCEEEFGFFRVTGDLRDKALAAIDALVVSDGAPEWTFEKDTAARAGQGNFVISAKRDSYSEVEQDANVAAVDALKKALEDMQVMYDEMKTSVDAMSSGADHTHSAESQAEAWVDDEMDEDTQLKTALALASVSFILWMLTIIGVLVKYVLHL